MAGVHRSGTRVILVTGKGGVGKTTLAAATAAVAAQWGAPTLLVSTDAAHSLEDVLLQRLGSEPVTITNNLDGLQLDGRHEMQRSWGSITQYLRRLVGITELDRLHVDELVVVPGLDQLVALGRLRSLVEEGSWEAIIVDCAPSADTLRLLALPDVLGWYIERIFGRNGALNRWSRRRIERTFAVPLPDDSVVGSVTSVTDELAGLRATLDRGQTSARIVTTPERVVIAEAQRTLAYLALYGYATDAVFVNRVPAPAQDGGAVGRSAMRRAQLEAIDATFAALPRLRVSDRPEEPLGIGALVEVGQELYGTTDPLAKLSPGHALEITSRGPESMVRLAVPGVERDQVGIEREGDELVVSLGAHRRSIVLPEGLRDRDVVRAGIDGHHLEIVFGERIGVG
jgi:arsenite/tail-anchored protein-transporting ATPase